jgi:hypothetical protein
MAVVEKKESFGKRHLVALIVGGFAVLLVVIVAASSWTTGTLPGGSPRCRSSGPTSCACCSSGSMQ